MIKQEDKNFDKLYQLYSQTFRVLVRYENQLEQIREALQNNDLSLVKTLIDTSYRATPKAKKDILVKLQKMVENEGNS